MMGSSNSDDEAYEYRIEERPFEIYELGYDGWQLVATIEEDGTTEKLVFEKEFGQ